MPAKPIELNHQQGQPVETKLIRLADIDDGFRAEWRALENDLETPNPYFYSWFLEPAMKYLALKDRVRLCVMRRSADGLLVGLVPLVAEATYAKIPLKRFEVWLHDHCYSGVPLMRRNFSTDVYGALIDWIDTHPEGARFLRFPEHPITAPLEQAFNTACSSRRRALLFQHQRERAVLTGGQDADDFIACSFNGKKRKELRRQARRMAELGSAEIETISGDAEISQAVENFIVLEMLGWKGVRDDAFPIGRSDNDQEFFKQAMIAGAQAGGVTVNQICVQGKPAAMLFRLHGDGYHYAFKIAHDEALNTYSPGVQILTGVTAEMLGDPQMRHFDSCARSGHPVADSLWRERMTVAQFNIPAGGIIDVKLLQFCAWIERCKNAILAWRNT